MSGKVVKRNHDFEADIPCEKGELNKDNFFALYFREIRCQGQLRSCTKGKNLNQMIKGLMVFPKKPSNKTKVDKHLLCFPFR